MKDYTKASFAFRLFAVAGALALLAWPDHAGQAQPEPLKALAGLDGAASTSTPAVGAFAGWHWPLPAGQWLVSRGPCGSGGLFTHACGYYEDRCAFDLTPLANSMLSVPVLAPQAGQVFFLGMRSDSGQTVLLRHADGRVSALMHLAKVVVGLDQRVARGQVVAYAGNSGSSTRPHLHFHVQPNAVERDCVPLTGLDEIDPVRMIVLSHNRAWSDLVLRDPPEHLPDWLALSAGAARAPRTPRLFLAPSTSFRLPVAVDDARLGEQGLYLRGMPLTPTLKLQGQSVFSVPLRGPAAPGEYQTALQIPSAPGQPTDTLTVTYSVRPPVDSGAALGLIWINPTFVSPANWANLQKTPTLCWNEIGSAGQAPLSFRVMVVGPKPADSGWQPADCWTPPALPAGTHYWKVFVRDARGYMNRTNQRPFAFRIP